MKGIFSRMLSAVAFATGQLAIAQGTFQDLDFEDANVVPIAGQPYAVSVANALPGWTVNYGNVQQSQILYNDPSLGGTAATLIANGYPTLTGETPIEGDFSVELYGGGVGGVLTPVSIVQTGQIPSGTQSLLFEWAGAGAPLQASIDNDTLTLFPVGSGIGENGVGYTIWGANISAWAGQTEQLSFSAYSSIGRLDDISFSPGAVPEPNEIALMGIGGLLFGLYRGCIIKR